MFFLNLHYLACINELPLQTSKGPVPCDDKEGHYIIVPDDMIFKRCELLSPNRDVLEVEHY
jgi:hypothetical protein